MPTTLVEMSGMAGRICFLGCAVAATARLGVQVSEERLLASAIGVRFRFGSIRASLSATRPVEATLEINSCDMHIDGPRLATFYRGQGLEMTARLDEDAPSLASQLGEISYDRPILLMVNSAHLPHWPVEARANAGHYLVCDGWDSSRNSASIVDAFVPTARQTFFHGEVPLDALLWAMNCEGFMGRPYCAAWTFATAPRDQQPAPVEPARMLQMSAREMLDAPDERLMYGGLEVTVAHGLRGIDLLATEVGRIQEASEGEHGGIREVFPLIASFGGPVPARAVLADFLYSAAQEMDPLGERLASECRDLSTGWKRFANLVLKGVSGAGAPAFARAAQYLQQLRRDERAFAEALASLPVDGA